MLFMTSDGVGQSAVSSNAANIIINFYRGSTLIFQSQISSVGGSTQCPPSAFLTLDPITAGTYTYAAKAFSGGGGGFSVTSAVLVAYEL